MLGLTILQVNIPVFTTTYKKTKLEFYEKIDTGKKTMKFQKGLAVDLHHDVLLKLDRCIVQKKPRKVFHLFSLIVNIMKKQSLCHH